MSAIKTVGKSGQISLGKSLAGSEFIVEELPGGDIMLKRAVVIPLNERWLHTPAMKRKLARADEWIGVTPARESSLDEIEAKIAALA